MQTLQPTLRLGRDVWDPEAMPIEEFKARAERLRMEMRPRSTDAVLLYGNGLDECGYPTYLSNYTVKLPFAALVILPADSDPVLIFQGSTRGRSAAQATTWIEDTRPCGDIAETCITALAEKNLLNGTIGLAGVRRLMPHASWTRLSSALENAMFVDAEPFLDRLRSLKSDRETSQIRRAARIVHRALGAMGGTNEWLLTAAITRDARMQGAEDVRVLIARPSQPAWAFRPPEESAIGESETVIVHLRASWERYWAEVTRTFVVNSGSLQIVDVRIHPVLRYLTPGRTVAEFVRSAKDAMGPSCSARVEEYGFGNGIGVGPAERPFLSAVDHTVIQPGMCFAIRLAFPDSKGGLIMRGDTIALTSRGAQILGVD